MTELDEETLRLMRHYSGDLSAPRVFTETVFCEYGGEEWTIDTFMASIQLAVSKIPEEHRSEAKVTLEGGYDETTSLTITYNRQETADELQARYDEALKHARGIQESERRHYEELRRKFESSDLRNDIRKAKELLEIAEEDAARGQPDRGA